MLLVVRSLPRRRCHFTGYHNWKWMTNRAWWVAPFVVCSFLLRLLTYFWLDQHFHFTLLLFLDGLLLFRPAHGTGSGCASSIVVLTLPLASRRARVLSVLWLESARTAIATHVVVAAIVVVAVSANDWPTFLWPSVVRTWPASPPVPTPPVWQCQIYENSLHKILFAVFNQIVSAKLLSNAFSIIKVINGLDIFQKTKIIHAIHMILIETITIATCSLYIINIPD